MSEEISKCANPTLDWKQAKNSRDWTAVLPDPKVEWVIEPVGDHDVWRAFKHCYGINDDRMQWVPLNGTFATPADAQMAIKTYLSTRHSVYLNAQGEVIPT